MTNEQRAWLLLGLAAGGFALGLTLAAALGLRGLEIVLGAAGGAAGYGLYRVVVPRLERRGRRGQLKYWRGRAFYDDEP